MSDATKKDDKSSEYEGKTVVELIALAKERGVTVPDDAKRADVIAALEAQPKTQQPEGFPTEPPKENSTASEADE